MRADRLSLFRGVKYVASRRGRHQRQYPGASYQVGLEGGGARDLSAVLGDADFAKTPLTIGDRVGLAWLDEDVHQLSPAS